MRTRPGVARHGTDVAAGGTVPTRRGRAVVTNSKTLTIQKVIIITLQDLSCGLKTAAVFILLRGRCVK